MTQAAVGVLLAAFALDSLAEPALAVAARERTEQPAQARIGD